MFRVFGKLRYFSAERPEFYDYVPLLSDGRAYLTSTYLYRADTVCTPNCWRVRSLRFPCRLNSDGGVGTQMRFPTLVYRDGRR